MKLDELNVYQISMELGQRIWTVVSDWNYFEKDTIGKQMVRAMDSVAANLSEGYGRFHYREARQFGYYARGSLFETRTWLKKSVDRKLIEQSEFDLIFGEMEQLGIKINNFIRSIGKSSGNQIDEDDAWYGHDSNQ
jgi:four helix bundle protein